MKRQFRSPLSIFGFGQELTPVAPESGAAATTSQCQGWAGPGGRSGLEAQHSLKACPSEAGSEVLSQDSEPLSPVAREYRRRPRNLSSELTEPKVLMATAAALMRRTPSVVQPHLFTFEDHFDFEAVIGRTPHSEVYRARHKLSGELFAVKRSMRQFRSRADRDRCLHEIQAVASLPAHPNVIGQYRAWQQSGHFFIQMDLAENGSLGHLLRQGMRPARCMQVQEEGLVLPDALVWQVLWEVAQGLEFLHSHGVIVMDIKPDNIFCNCSGTFQIGDFGMAVVSSLNWDWEEGDGDYLAPELLQEASPTPAADIYSLGATLYECATGEKLPRDGAEGRQLGLLGQRPVLRSVIQRMLQPNPADRPSAAGLVQQVSAMRLPVAMQQAPQAAAAAHQMRACAREASPGTPAQHLFARSAGFQTPQRCHAEVGGQELPSAPSLALQQEPCSPSAVATPVLFGGPRAQAHTREPSRGDAEMWEGGDARDLGAELFSNLSVTCSMSPTEDCDVSTPKLPSRPGTADLQSLTGSTAYVHQKRWGRERPRGRSEAAAHVRPFPSLLHQTSNASTLSNGSTVMEDAEFPLSPMAAAGEGLGDLCSTPCFGRPSRFGQPVAHSEETTASEAKRHQHDNSHAWNSPARERPPVSPFAAQQFQGTPCDAVCSITVKSSASQDMRQRNSLPKERSLSFVYAC
ncbi:hypothetical protein CVIRNUC_001546 [Coccomyxa viridis]|uniref:Protein kinase domain-containing protein n=1 Tax=Coccomyxa viridis TaxID=1274662 RepID=A0AAV1HUT9_9CHLO|nr:hypothetical protein CVIRNUC_001546 [Coccomyxa viridis]